LKPTRACLAVVGEKSSILSSLRLKKFQVDSENMIRKEGIGMNRISFLYIGLAICFLGGCQGSITTDYDKLDIATVRGNVQFDGSPLVDAYIIFQADNKTYSYGKTDSKGNYRLMLNTEKAGILPGKKTVRIRLSRAFGAEGASLDRKSDDEDDSDIGSGEGEDGEGEEVETKNGKSKKPRKRSDEIPDSYHKDSKIIVEVKSGSQTFDFDLNSDGSTTSAK